jgi:hypothetical protein
MMVGHWVYNYCRICIIIVYNYCMFLQEYTRECKNDLAVQISNYNHQIMQCQHFIVLNVKNINKIYTC